MALWHVESITKCCFKLGESWRTIVPTFVSETAVGVSNRKWEPRRVPRELYELGADCIKPGDYEVYGRKCYSDDIRQ